MHTTHCLEDGRGGAIYAYGYESNIIVRNSAIINNSANFGAGIFMDQATGLSLESTELNNNQSSQCGGGLYSNSTNINIENSIFSNNSDICGGPGLFIEYGTGLITNTTIADNNWTTNQGPVRLYYVSDFVIKNSILNGGISPSGSEYFVSFSISDIDLNGQHGSNNLVGDPLFLDEANGDFRLSSF